MNDRTEEIPEGHAWMVAMGREEPDVFAVRSYALATLLSEWFKPSEVRPALEQMITPLGFTGAKPRHVIFVPFTHLEAGRTDAESEESERRLAEELPILLEKILGRDCDDCLVACGESYGVPLTPESNFKGREESVVYWNRFLRPQIDATTIKRLVEQTKPAFEKALFDYLALRDIESAGVECLEASIVGAELKRDWGFLIPGPGFAERSASLHRIEVEVRTRYALDAAARIAGGRTIVFLQGYGHLYSVQGWAARRGVEMTTRCTPYVQQAIEHWQGRVEEPDIATLG